MTYIFYKRPERDRYCIEYGSERVYAQNIQDARIRAYKMAKKHAVAGATGRPGTVFIYRKVEKMMKYGSDFDTHAKVTVYFDGRAEYEVIERNQKRGSDWGVLGMGSIHGIYQLHPNGRITSNLGYVQPRVKRTRRVKRAEMQRDAEDAEYWHNIFPDQYVYNPKTKRYQLKGRR